MDVWFPSWIKEQPFVMGAGCVCGGGLGDMQGVEL